MALNHFGSTIVGKEYVQNVISEAQKGNQDASQIVASHDFMEIWVPRGGFDFNAKIDKKECRGVRNHTSIQNVVQQIQPQSTAQPLFSNLIPESNSAVSKDP